MKEKGTKVNDLIEIGETTIEQGKKFGAEEIEVYFEHTRTNRVNVYTGYVDTFGGEELGVGVRATIGKKVGFSSATVRSNQEIVEVIRRATKIAKLKEEDPHFHHLPDPTRGAGKKGIFDDQVSTLKLRELTKLAKTSTDEGKDVGDFVENIDVTAVASVIKKAIVSTRGILNGDKRTYLYAYGSVKGKKDEELTTGVELVMGRKLKEDALLKVGYHAAKRAERMFGGEELDKPRSGQLVVENVALPSFLWPLVFNVNGNNVADKRSRFLGKQGKQVASDITVVDDGTLEEGIRTAEVDDEGIPMTKKKIIDDGILKSYLFDSYAALRMDQESTGNAIRSGYSDPPSLSYTNLRIPNGSGNLEALRREIDQGILVTGMVMGAHLTNPIKGNFGLTCKNAFLVEDGEIKYPLKEATVSGDFFELLKNIRKVGSDTKLTQSGKLPSIMVTGIDFA
ncbi:MAG: TldD/PmbA family protein [Candidatus Korarchaeota archaeon]|nr:TldD/PmbA family protein [Candidatus Korarchaeota archaeon]NIU84248.1 hypothetical protein [Candidatus Thorarchaeota archaeon]NIW14411.1 hypothetical protein [Candidatus Thorarchaeota archaeon]NIW52480.1 hypothetical protein [Candidatus Korarchaeota archaeon]